MSKNFILFIITLLIGYFFQTERVFAIVLPQYVNTKVVGGPNSDWGHTIMTDNLGNLYILGGFGVGTLDFNPGEGVDNFTSVEGQADLSLTKYNPDGTYAWTKTWGGTGLDDAYSFTFDSNNNIYLSAEFSTMVDFDPGEGVDVRTSAGSVDIALIKLNADGSYGWTKTMGSTSHDRLQAVQISSNDSIYIAGKFNGTVDFDPGEGVDNHTSLGNYDMFFTKFNPDGSYFWTKTWGSTYAGSGDSVEDIIIDSNDNIYLVGTLRTTVNFDPTEGVDERTSLGGTDVYLTKYNSDDTYAWTKTWGGTNNDYGFAVRVNSNNDIYVVGSYQLTVDFDPTEAVNNFTSAGSEDSYVSKFKSDGMYDFTYTWGGPLMDGGTYSVAFDAQGNWYIGGFFNGTIDFDPTSGTNVIASSGLYNQFFSVFDVNDNYLLTKAFGSSDATNWWEQILYDLCVFGNTLYITGSYGGTTDFNPDAGVDEYTSVGGPDIYYSKYNLVYTPTLTTLEASLIEKATATLNGSITTSEGEDATSRGFNYGPTDSYGTTVSESTGPYGAGAFSLNISELACNTTYHYRSFATNTADTGYGNDVSFITPECPSSGSRPSKIKIPVSLPNTVCIPGNKFSTETGLLCTSFIANSTILSGRPTACSITLTLKQGNKGDQVKCLQNKLNLTPDSIFGPMTKATVILFQKNHNLVQDGIVGPVTSGVINLN
jgi:peptidoglycan hydrolase-like protein with peptidoglycan-binding domain